MIEAALNATVADQTLLSIGTGWATVPSVCHIHPPQYVLCVIYNNRSSLRMAARSPIYLFPMKMAPRLSDHEKNESSSTSSSF